MIRGKTNIKIPTSPNVQRDEYLKKSNSLIGEIVDVLSTLDEQSQDLLSKISTELSDQKNIKEETKQEIKLFLESVRIEQDAFKERNALLIDSSKEDVARVLQEMKSYESTILEQVNDLVAEVEARQGPQGVPGNDGEQGPVGPAGVQGEPGKDGKDGKDADEDSIVKKVLKKIEFTKGSELIKKAIAEVREYIDGQLTGIRDEMRSRTAMRGGGMGETEVQVLIDAAISTGDQIIKDALGITVDGASVVLTTGTKGYRYIEQDCTITGWHVAGDVTGSVVFDVKRSGVSLAGTEKPTLSTQQYNSDTALTTWTTTLNAGDVIEFVIDSVATLSRATLTILVTKN